MNKSTIALMSALCFFSGMAAGIITGFLAAPIKHGLTFNMSFNNCGNTNKTAAGKKKKHSGKIFGLPGKNRSEKGKRKWIGRK